MISQIKIVGVNVKDQARALDFYKNKLGFEVLEDAPYGDGNRWIEVAPSGAQTRITLSMSKSSEERASDSPQIVFSCSDVRETFRELSERGVHFTQEPKEEPWGTFAMFDDSEGNTFVIGSE